METPITDSNIVSNHKKYCGPLVKAELARQLEIRLRKANDLLRSTHAIAQRKGAETNWGAFELKVMDELETQHALLWPIDGTDLPRAAGKGST